MDTIKTWGDFHESVEPKWVKTPRPKDCIFFSGYLDAAIGVNQARVGDDVYQIAEQVEAIVREAFSGLEVLAVQTPDTYDPDYDATRYRAFVEGLDGDKQVMSILLSAYHLESNNQWLPAVLGIEALFALGEYQIKAKQAVEKLWGLVESVELTPSKPPEDALYPGNFEPGLIALRLDWKPVATGYPCLSIMGWDLPPKRMVERIAVSGQSEYQ